MDTKKMVDIREPGGRSVWDNTSIREDLVKNEKFNESVTDILFRCIFSDDNKEE